MTARSLRRRLSRVAVATASLVMVAPLAIPEVASAGVEDAKQEVERIVDQLDALHEQADILAEELRERAGPPDVVVVDPPRAGLSGKALRRVAGLGAEKIVYVSCNPTTLAGNAAELSREHGYLLERARPVDMFPHTPHVETVALFTSSGA